MYSTDKAETLPPAPVPASSHRLPFLHRHHHRHHHQCLEVSPHCPNIHHHNHDHLHVSSDCPLHRHLLPHCPIHTPMNPIIPNFSSTPNPNFNSSIPSPETATSNSISQPLMMQEMNEQDYEDDEEEVIFVLTDEWKDFFAKSEAKRRLAKKQAKKKGKD